LLTEPFRFRGNDEESVYSFASRRFGEEVATTFLDPMISGICAGDFKKIDIKSLFPRLRNIEKEYRSLLLFMLSYKKRIEKGSGKKKRVFLSLKDGMGSIFKQVEADFKDHIRKECKVSIVRKERVGYKIILENKEELFAEKIVFATPSFVTKKLIEDIDNELSSQLSKISYTDLVTVSIGVSKDKIAHPCDGFGFLIPRNSGIRILGGMFLSGIFKERAPSGKEIIKCYIGGEHDLSALKLTDEEIEGIVAKELSKLLGVKEIEFFQVKRIKNGIPQYNMGHKSVVEKIKNLLEERPNIHLAGNYLSGVSIDKAIESGFYAKKKWA
jgi:oxygen-dependent protoporphyrinogen oxidase